jgi:putative flippase GtrA
VNDLIARLSRSRFLRFLIVGGFGFLVSEAVLLTVHAAGANTTVAWFAAFAASVTFTWWGNRNLTFGDRKAAGTSGILAEYGKFVASNAVGGAVNFSVFKTLEIYGPAPLNLPFAALAFGVLAGLMFNFTMARLLVFRGGSPTP